MDGCTPEKLAHWWQRQPAAELCHRLRQHLRHEPRCALTHYLLGCLCFDRGQRACGVRHMMVAHHVEPALESAALLVFAGLNWTDRADVPMLPVLLDTWEEFRRPNFDRRQQERRLLDAFAETCDGLEDASPLARRLWRLPIRVLRAQIREAAVTALAPAHRLLLATASC